jgi:hypothetical protein
MHPGPTMEESKSFNGANGNREMCAKWRNHVSNGHHLYSLDSEIGMISIFSIQSDGTP